MRIKPLMYQLEKAKKIMIDDYERLREQSPHAARAAHYYILSMLALHAPNRVPCFLGECAVDHIELSNLSFARFMMHGMFALELKGSPKITPMMKEVMCRRYLGLPPLVIEGGHGVSL